MKKLILVLVCFTLFLSFGPSSPSSAETFAPLGVTIDTFEDNNTAAFQACTAPAIDCSLRGAISLSNATTGGIGTIFIPTGTYTLTIPGANEYLNETGSLDIREPVTLQGEGQGTTIIQAGPSKSNGIDRVFKIHDDLSGTAHMSDLTIRWGTITSGSEGGAGIFHNANAYGTLILERVTIEENVITNDQSGGGLLSSGILTIRDSSFVNNSAVLGEGGGIYHADKIFTCERTTIAGNIANYGGGLANQDEAVLRNVTISGNTAGNSGGGVSQWNDGDLTIYNTTVVNNSVTGGNTSGWAVQDYLFFYAYNSILASAAGSHPCINGIDGGFSNLATDISCGATGFIIGDPLLGALNDNGGFTRTHSLSLGSPAMDAADNASCPVVDQRGVRRRYDGDSNGSLICDIGAYEYNTGLTLLNIFTPLIVRP